MIQQITFVTHSLYVKLSKNSKDYGEPDITYQLAGCAEHSFSAFGLMVYDKEKKMKRIIMD